MKGSQGLCYWGTGIMDKGPWAVFYGSTGKLLGVLSNDFEHDVYLEVHGDFFSDGAFGEEGDKLDYCRWLAATLNASAAYLDAISVPKPSSDSCNTSS
jgi:hypothetical protein